MKPKWVKATDYNRRERGLNEVCFGSYVGPLQEWCHACSQAHPFPAYIYCPKKSPHDRNA